VVFHCEQIKNATSIPRTKIASFLCGLVDLLREPFDHQPHGGFVPVIFFGPVAKKKFQDIPDFAPWVKGINIPRISVTAKVPTVSSFE